MPLTFLLGFYVSLVVKRWWEQYIKLPWPDEVAILFLGIFLNLFIFNVFIQVATLLKAGITEKTAEEEREEGGENLRIRRTVVRYMMLSYVLCLRRISSKVRSKYPDIDSLLASRLIRVDEVTFLCFVIFLQKSFILGGKDWQRGSQEMAGQGWATWQVKLVDAYQLERQHCSKGNERQTLVKCSDLRKPGQIDCSFPQEPD